MSTPIISRIPRPARGFAPRSRRASLPAQALERVRDQGAVRGSRQVHLAEQGYTAELARAARRRAGRGKPPGRPPLLQARAVGMARAAREWLPARAQRPSVASEHSREASEIGIPEAPRRSDRRRWIALAVLCLGQLMMVLDATIVNVALPSIQTSLNASLTSLKWVVDAYALALASLLLISG